MREDVLNVGVSVSVSPELAGFEPPDGGVRTWPPGRPGSHPPGPPQIRTCPTQAYGSSSHRFAVTCILSERLGPLEAVTAPEAH